MSDLEIQTKDRVTVVTLARPPVNALTLALYERLGEVFDSFATSLETSCVVFTGAGSRAFCAGLDLHEFVRAKPEDDAHRAAIVRRCFAAVRGCAVPVVAAVNGPALGAGCVLTSVCDVRIAARNATFALPEINVGRCGGGAHMGRHLPQGTMRRMFFTGQPIDAAEAYRLGYVDRVVDSEALMETALALAATIASKSPLGLRYGKRALNEAEFLPVEDGYAIEQGYSTKLLATEDAKEAARAAIEKRAPRFVGR